MSNESKIAARWGNGGALVCDELPASLSHLRSRKLDPGSARFYGGRYLIAESMSIHTARIIAKALSLNIEETK